MRGAIFVLAMVVLFVIAVVSPRTASKLQRRITKRTRRLKRRSNWLWAPLADASKKSLELAKKFTKTILRWGKTVRKKLPF